MGTETWRRREVDALKNPEFRELHSGTKDMAGQVSAQVKTKKESRQPYSSCHSSLLG